MCAHYFYVHNVCKFFKHANYIGACAKRHMPVTYTCAYNTFLIMYNFVYTYARDYNAAYMLLLTELMYTDH